MGKNTLAHFDLWLLIVAVGLVLFGLLAVYNASVVSAERDFADKYHYLRDQATWTVLGLGLMFVVSFIDYHFWQKIALPIFIGTLLLLFLVFVPGLGIGALGAKRWVNFGFFVVQPSEIAKLSLVVYLASWFCRKEKGRFFAFVLLVGLVVGLVMLEPDMGTGFILAVMAIILYFISGAPIYQFLLLIPLTSIAFLLLVQLAPYRLQRLLTFFNPQSDPLGSGYHIKQALFALGSGGLTGVGIGKSLQKYAYLPESTTDSIFAILAEELGFIGAGFFMVVLAFFVFRAFTIAKNAPDSFGKLLGLGIACSLGVQMVTNIAAQVALLPFTGVPLPFISYGGSSLIVTLISVGILLNISKRRT